MLEPSSYAFRNEDKSILTLDSIGWQRVRSTEYSFSGDERPDSGHVIFQYTLSGQAGLMWISRSCLCLKVPDFWSKFPVNTDTTTMIRRSLGNSMA